MSNIQNTIDNQIKELKITSLDISFNELADMYQDGELIINPDYQRLFRWDIGKQSRFIESLLLEMPIPPIYVIEVEDGKYELIDGLQRISSYLCFRGIYKIIEEPNNKIDDADEDVIDDLEDEECANNSFNLNGCDIIPELNGLTYEELPTNLKIRAKRCFVRMEVLRKGINPTLKYHMFKRLNTGGEKLSPQEIRNCSIRLIDSKFIDFINRLAQNSDFQETICYIQAEKKSKKFAEELVLRFFALKNDIESFSHHMDSFLTNYMEKVSSSDISKSPIFNYDEEEEIFNKTFKYLKIACGKKAFSVYKGKSNKLSGFNVYQYEAISYGIQAVLNKLDSGEMTTKTLKEKLEEAKKDETFKTATTGGGKNSSGVMKTRCEFIVRKLGE